MQTQETSKPQGQPPVIPMKAVAKTDGTDVVSTETLEHTSWGAEGAKVSDIKIPRLMLMQGLSKSVSAGEFQVGDIVHSGKKEVLGGKGKHINIVPFFTFTTQEYFEKENGKWEHKWTRPFIKGDREQESLLSNRKAWYGVTVSGGEHKYDFPIHYYVLIDGDNTLPAMLKCGGTNRSRAGQDLATHFCICDIEPRQPPAKTTFKLTSHSETNDLGTFFVLDVVRAGETKLDTLVRAHRWWQTITKGYARLVVDEDETTAETVERVPF